MQLFLNIYFGNVGQGITIIYLNTFYMKQKKMQFRLFAKGVGRM
jgi:hypothetical protein